MSKGLVTRYWLAGAIALAVAAGALWPGPARAIPRLHLIDVGVVVVMFLGSLKLARSSFRQAARRLDLVLLSLLAVFAIAPAASILGAKLVGLGGAEDRIAVLLCFAQASTLATAVVLTEIAGGDVALAMVLTVVNNLATAVLTPLVFELAAGTEIAVDPLAMAAELALKIVAPAVAAQVARRWLASFAQRHKRRLSVASQLVILVYVYTGVGAASARLEGAGDLVLRVLGLVVAMHLFMLIATSVLARIASRDPGARAALVLCSSQKTLPAALLVWNSHFPALVLGPLVAVAHHALQLVIDSLLAPDFLRLPLISNRAKPTPKTIDSGP